jgi:hypothetical protein
MSRKNNTRSIKKIQDTAAQRIDTRRRLEQQAGRTTQGQPTQGTGWNFIPATSADPEYTYEQLMALRPRCSDKEGWSVLARQRAKQ